MIEIRAGKVLKGKAELQPTGEIRYRLRVHWVQTDGKLSAGAGGCSGCAQAYLDNDWRERFTEFMSWGYEGRGSDLTAAYMLRHFTDRQLGDLVGGLVIQFAREVVDHLPDEWTMTSDDVLEWLKKKEGG